MRKRAENDDILLQHDNAKPHTTVATADATAHLGFTVLPHPVYNPDLGPRDFRLLPKLKEDFRSQNFRSDEEVNAAVHQWFLWGGGLFKDKIQKLVKCWRKCIESEEIMWKSDYAQL